MSQYLLSDGREVTIRAIRADDGARLRESHSRLSAESKYRRFLSAKPELTVADARYLVDVDGCDHFALVATVQLAAADAVEAPGGAARGQEETIIAVTRFVRLPEHPDTAEFAIVVGDDYQRHGLAGELVRRLAAAAAERGIRRFRASMLSDNVAIFRLLRQVATGPLQQRRDGDTCEVDVDLTPDRVGARAPAPAMIAAWAGS